MQRVVVFEDGGKHNQGRNCLQAIEHKFVCRCLVQIWPRYLKVSICYSRFSIPSSASNLNILKGSNIAFQYANKQKYWCTINLWHVEGIWFVIEFHPYYRVCFRSMSAKEKTFHWYGILNDLQLKTPTKSIVHTLSFYILWSTKILREMIKSINARDKHTWTRSVQTTTIYLRSVTKFGNR